MSYDALPGRVIPYHDDGTEVKLVRANGTNETTLNSTQMEELNDTDYTAAVTYTANPTGTAVYLFFYFPEARQVAGIFFMHALGYCANLQGSNDTTNGFDGSWEDAVAPSGYNELTDTFDAWRSSIAPVSFTEPKQVWRILTDAVPFTTNRAPTICHLYTPTTGSDIQFLDADSGDAEFSAPVEFGDVRENTTNTHNFKLYNASSTLTANSVTLTVTDPENSVTIWDGDSWETTYVVGNISPETATSSIAIRLQTPVTPDDLGPYRAQIAATVGSWT